MRRGELLGLKWSDIDWGRGVISIKRALKQSRRGLELEKPKTARSARTIALPPVAIEELRSHKAIQAERRMRLGKAYNDIGLVLAGPDGAFIRPDALSTNFAGFIRRHPELPKVRFHDLRHTHASLLLEAGEHAKVVSERLGHSSVAFTLDTYGHLMPGMEAGGGGEAGWLIRRCWTDQEQLAARFWGRCLQNVCKWADWRTGPKGSKAQFQHQKSQNPFKSM